MWIALSTLALAQEAPPIIGGEETTRFKPVGAMVAVKGNSGGQFCSGTLVKANRVVTAAHCIEAGWEYEDYGYDVYFVLAEDVYDSWDDYKLAKDLIAHPDYDAYDLQHDIGVMKLDGGISSVGTMSLNTESLKANQKGDTVTYVGFGSEGMHNGSGVKRYVEVELWQYDNQFLYTGYSGNTVKNVCPGDSGGAALMWREAEEKFELVGANSFIFNWNGGNYDCHLEDAGGAATRVDKNLDFLGEYMEIEIEGEGDSDTDSDADSDTDSDADSDADSDTDSDTDTDVQDSGDTGVDNQEPGITPGPGCGCSGAGGLGGLAAVALAGLFAARRRRD